MNIQYFSEWISINENKAEPPLPLKFGDKGPGKGDWILKIQNRLRCQKTGLFLEETKEAVEKYQKDIMKIKPSGQVGPQTWNSLFPNEKVTEKTNPQQNKPQNGDKPPLPLKFGDKGPGKGDWILKIQNRLRQKETGLFLEETKEAVEKYQKDIMKIKPTGQVGPQTWNSLFPNEKVTEKTTPKQNKPQNNKILTGIDVSSWNKTPIKWKVAKKNGLSFAYIRSSMGDERDDPKFAKHSSDCQNLKIPWGAYHYYTFSEDKQKQLNNITSKVPKSSPLPVALDLEFYGHDKNEYLEVYLNKVVTRNKKRKSNRDHARDEIVYILKGLEKFYGRKPIIYCGRGYFQRIIKGYKPLESYKLWVTSPDKKWEDLIGEVGQERLIIHQEKGVNIKPGRFPGLEGNVDINKAHSQFWLQN